MTKTSCILIGPSEFDNHSFDVEKYISIESAKRKQRILQSHQVCRYWLQNSCVAGNQCPFRHSRGEKSVVCKHWLRGLCKKSDDCEYLHVYDMTKLPNCHFFMTFGTCNNSDCLFLHAKPEDNIKECPWYARGFCKHGPACRNRHGLRVHCQNYVLGFCPDGPKCKFGHPKYELPISNFDPRSQMAVSQNYLRTIRANLKKQLQNSGFKFT